MTELLKGEKSKKQKIEKEVIKTESKTEKGKYTFTLYRTKFGKYRYVDYGKAILVGN